LVATVEAEAPARYIGVMMQVSVVVHNRDCVADTYGQAGWVELSISLRDDVMPPG
jgi:hypothetical protein